MNRKCDIKYKGVYKNSRRDIQSKRSIKYRKDFPFKATIWINGCLLHLGLFKTEREAALAYDRKAIEIGRETNILKRVAA